MKFYRCDRCSEEFTPGSGAMWQGKATISLPDVRFTKHAEFPPHEPKILTYKVRKIIELFEVNIGGNQSIAQKDLCSKCTKMLELK